MAGLGVRVPVYNSIAEDLVPVTPSDSDDLTNGPCAALYIGTGGTVKFDTITGETRTITGIVSGTVLLVKCTRVYDTGTDASDISAYY